MTAPSEDLPQHHPRDISANDLQRAMEASAHPAILARLVELSRATFGFFPCLYPHTISYPWAVTRLSQLPPGSRLLDIGAGVSAVPLFLAEKGFLLETVDSSNHVRTLPLSRQSNEWGFFDYRAVIPSCTSYHCDIMEFTPTTPYAGIYSIGALAHMTHPVREEVLRRCHHWLAPAGLLLLTIDLIPASDFLWNRSEGHEVESPTAHGTIDDLVTSLQQLRYQVDEVKVTRTVYNSRTDLLFVAARKSKPESAE